MAVILSRITRRGLAFVVVDLVMFSFAVAWTGMRIWVKRSRRAPVFLAEDWFIYLALVGGLRPVASDLGN